MMMDLTVSVLSHRLTKKAKVKKVPAALSIMLTRSLMK